MLDCEHKMNELTVLVYFYWTLVDKRLCFYRGAEQEEKGGKGEGRKVEVRKNYYHPVPSLLIKNITSNMFLMTGKAGGN
uniref:Uncharacterized protein n=1 Tax=Nothobranchius furzeri TaxID=105023 RepID=A0A8C6L8N6_NOTFU